MCAGVVTIDRKSNTISLDHHTTQEYLERIRRERFSMTYLDIMRTCLTYLQFDEIVSGCSKKFFDFSRQVRIVRFLDYACHFWDLQLRLAKDVKAQEQAFQVLNDKHRMMFINEFMDF